MAQNFVITCQLIAYDADANPMQVGNAAPVTTVRTLEDFNLIRTSTNATPNTIEAVPLGTVASGAMEFALCNLSETDSINILLDYSGTKQVIATVRPGDTRVLSLLKAPYVEAAVASVPYLAGVAAL